MFYTLLVEYHRSIRSGKQPWHFQKDGKGKIQVFLSQKNYYNFLACFCNQLIFNKNFYVNIYSVPKLVVASFL